MNNKNFEEAINSFKKDIDEDPNHTEAHYNIAVCHYHLKNYTEAIDSYTKSSELSPEDALPLKNIGDCHTDLKNHEEAIKFYKKSLEKSPEEYWATYGIALNHYALKKFNEAKKWFDSANNINPDESGPYFYKGSIAAKKNLNKEALKMYSKSAEISPEDSTIYYNISIIQKDMKKYEEAMDSLNKAIDLRESPLYYCLKAKINLYNLKNKEEAIKDLTRAKEMITNNEETGNISPDHLKFISSMIDHMFGVEKKVDDTMKIIEGIKDEKQKSAFLKRFQSIVKDKNELNLNFGRSGSIGGENKEVKINEGKLNMIMAELESLQSKVEGLEDKVGGISESTLRYEKVKSKVEKVGNQNLIDFMDGFQREFSIAMVGVQAICSGNISFEGETDPIVSYISKGISYIPFLGETISGIIDKIHEEVAVVKVEKNAKNLSNFGVSTTRFDQLAQYLSGKIILDPKFTKVIENYTEEETKGFVNNVYKLIDKVSEIYDDVTDYLYKDYTKENSPQKLLGHVAAQEIIEYILSEEVQTMKDLRDENKEEILIKKLEEILKEKGEVEEEEEEVKKSEVNDKGNEKENVNSNVNNNSNTNLSSSDGGNVERTQMEKEKIKDADKQRLDNKSASGSNVNKKSDGCCLIF